MCHDCGLQYSGMFLATLDIEIIYFCRPTRLICLVYSIPKLESRTLMRQVIYSSHILPKLACGRFMVELTTRSRCVRAKRFAFCLLGHVIWINDCPFTDKSCAIWYLNSTVITMQEWVWQLPILEAILCQDPHVQSAVFFGNGRFQNGVIIDPKKEFAFDPKDEHRLIEFRNSIW